jgi:hypothetical protein
VVRNGFASGILTLLPVLLPGWPVAHPTSPQPFAMLRPQAAPDDPPCESDITAGCSSLAQVILLHGVIRTSLTPLFRPFPQPWGQLLPGVSGPGPLVAELEEALHGFFIEGLLRHDLIASGNVGQVELDPILLRHGIDAVQVAHDLGADQAIERAVGERRHGHTANRYEWAAVRGCARLDMIETHNS